ncbi:MAG: 2OG-Fe dioxygenase family protein [Proteobacteria bacterium]|nr:2OG-Fe dioxygenase family protein [Pseudomonadota bacterium]
MNSILAPELTPIGQLPATLRQRGFAVLDAASVCNLAACTPLQLQALSPSWNDLPVDHHLKDGGRYRRRRHSCFVVEGENVRQVPHRAHWQPIEYNALHGGMQRMFEPMQPASLQQVAWPLLVRALATTCSAVKGARPWYVEAHQFRIDTAGGIGRPTPEGAHRDGVDFVAILLIERRGIKGGESRVFEADGPHGQRFTLSEPWTLLMLDDERVIHETTPIQPTGEDGHRDTLVLTFRANGFQE